MLELVKNELRLELRNRGAISSILLYTLSSIFIIYLIFKSTLPPQLWNTLLWIVILFSTIQTTHKSFIRESGKSFLYVYTLAKPSQLIFSKIIYYSGLNLFIGVLSLLSFLLLHGNPVQNWSLFLVNLVIGTASLAAVFTFVSAIASKINAHGSIAAVLGLPIITPAILLTSKVSKLAVDGINWSACSSYLLSLVLLYLITGALSIILFPYLWKE